MYPRIPQHFPILRDIVKKNKRGRKQDINCMSSVVPEK